MNTSFIEEFLYNNTNVLILLADIALQSLFPIKMIDQVADMRTEIFCLLPSPLLD